MIEAEHPELYSALREVSRSLLELAALCARIDRERRVDARVLAELVARHSLVSERAKSLLTAYTAGNAQLRDRLDLRLFEIALEETLHQQGIGTAMKD